MSTDQLARFKGNLLAIGDAYQVLADRDRALVRDERVGPGYDRRHREYYDDNTSAVVYGRPDGTVLAADPVAAALPSGPSKDRRNGPVVGGSHEAKVPINLDTVDLLGPANEGSLLVADLTPWPQDQVGHIAILTELDFWASDIADFVGERRPRALLPDLIAFLHEWAGWAWDHYGALDEMVVTVDRLAKTLYAIQNDRRDRPEAKSAPCPGCGSATLTGDGETVRCAVEDCARVLTQAEYRTWAAAEAHRTLTGGEGISAKAIALRWDRPVGTVHYWANQYAWPRSNGEQRPVLYLRSAVEESVAGILEREAKAKAEREARAA